MLMLPIRMAVLLEDLEFGGTQRYAIQLLKNLDRSLFSPELWVLRGGFGMLCQAGETGAKITWLSRGARVGPDALCRLMKELRSHTPDLLYTLTVIPNIWGRILGALAHVPVIVSGWRSLYPNQYESVLWRLSTRIICNAVVLKAIMIQKHKVAPQRVAVIPNGVDTEYFSPECRRKAAPPCVLSIGRLVREKDPLTLLEAFRIVSRRIEDARLLLVGSGPLYGKLEDFIRKNRLVSRIQLSPGCPDPRLHFARASVFAMASIREASPNAALEAMSCGLPQVVTRVGGLPELVVDGETGLIVEPSNPVALADGITGLLLDESRRCSMGLRARARALERYRLGRMIAETQQVLMDAMGEAGH